MRENLASPFREVRKYILEKLDTKEELDGQHLREMLTGETDPEIRQQLAGILCKVDPAYLQEVTGHIDQHEPGIRKVIITSMLNQREFKFLLEGGNALNKLIHSEVPAERTLAIDITSDLKNVRFTDAIEELVHDPVASVKRQAIIAAGKLRTRKLLPHFAKMLEHPTEKYLALQGLQQYGDELFQHLRDLSDTELENVRSEFIKLAGKNRGHHSTHYLLARLVDGNSPLDQVIHALWIKDYEPASSKEVEELNGLLRQSLESANRKVKDYFEVPDFADKPLLQESIDHEIRNDLQTALKICSILFNKTEFNRIIELMEHGDHKRLMNAIEMLELVLPKKIAKDINLIFDYILDPTLHGHKFVQPEINGFFGKIVNDEKEAFGPWTRAVCIYCSWKNKQMPFLNALKVTGRPKEHYIVQETRDFVLKAIEK
jgi:hypothetical protein